MASTPPWKWWRGPSPTGGWWSTRGSARPKAPPAPAGRFYFEVAIGNAARAYWPKPGVFDARFIDMVVNYQDGSGGPKAQADYLAYKHDLIGRLRSMAVGDLFESRDIPAWTVPPPPAPIEVIDHGTLLRVSFADCVAYHGRTSIGGLALGYRLLQHAFARLSPGTAPDRDSISVFTAFPGPGLRDALELVTRVVTRGAYKADPAADVPGPAGVTGRMYFEVEIGGRRLRLALDRRRPRGPGVHPPRPQEQGRRSHARRRSALDRTQGSARRRGSLDARRRPVRRAMKEGLRAKAARPLASNCHARGV